ncbi:MAG: HD domain-containing protein [Acidimicrobiales bacterium]
MTHPLAVAAVVAELRADPDTVLAAVLHDTVEDTDATIEDVHAAFGASVWKRWWTGPPRWRRCLVTRTPWRPPGCASCSSPWPPIPGWWSSRSPTGCTTCARSARCRSPSGPTHRP